MALGRDRRTGPERVGPHSHAERGGALAAALVVSDGSAHIAAVARRWASHRILLTWRRRPKRDGSGYLLVRSDAAEHRSACPASPSSEQAPRDLLVVAMPTTPGMAPLLSVTRERDLLAGLFAQDEPTILQGADASRQAVSDALDDRRWVHFACHGMQDLNDPSRGGVLLADGILTIAEIGGGRNDQGEFACLSACKTAIGGVSALDEAITLVAALQHAGWRHVIGTLWSVWDTAAVDVTASLYPLLVSNGTFRPDKAAPALHHAVRELRDRTPSQPSMWAPFLHAGP
jgi:CHAT domain-containing protein